MIEIPDLGHAHHEMWVELMTLGGRSPAPWTLIGAQMVALHGWALGQDQMRASEDADLLIDCRVAVKGVPLLVAALIDDDFELYEESMMGVGHRFRRGQVKLDVLAPDGIGERADLHTVGTFHTVRVPGGTQALGRSSNVAVRSRDVEGTVPMPSLLGAILVKVRAIAVDDVPEAQRRDVAFLLSLVEDPDVLKTELTKTEIKWLRAQKTFEDPGAPPWRGISAAENGAIVYRRLTS